MTRREIEERLRAVHSRIFGLLYGGSGDTPDEHVPGLQQERTRLRRLLQLQWQLIREDQKKQRSRGHA